MKLVFPVEKGGELVTFSFRACLLTALRAHVAELVDALDSGSSE